MRLALDTSLLGRLTEVDDSLILTKGEGTDIYID